MTFDEWRELGLFKHIGHYEFVMHAECGDPVFHHRHNGEGDYEVVVGLTSYGLGSGSILIGMFPTEHKAQAVILTLALATS